MDVTDEQWAMLESLIPEEERQPSGRGRPWRPARDVFNGILWIFVDLANRCSVARLAGAVPPVPNGPSPLQPLG